MAVNTPIEIVESYQGLLIMQYLNLPKASQTIGFLASQAIIPQTSVQDIDFSGVATTGTFVLSYNGNNTASINWNDSASSIQTKLQAVTGLSSVTVAGSIASQTLTVTFTGVIAPALMLEVVSTTLMASSVVITITIVETDETIPLAVQDGFNLTGSNLAVGAQLDIIGQYAGVTRTGQGFSTQITLDDADFLKLIYMAISKNSSGSSLYDIQNFLATFFPGQILVFDNKDMTMDYIIGQDVGSFDLIQLFITEQLLPQPMAVAITVFNPLSAALFSFANVQGSISGPGFNTAKSPQIGYWLSAHDLVSA